jgi:hypothetical protein
MLNIPAHFGGHSRGRMWICVLAHVFTHLSSKFE